MARESKQPGERSASFPPKESAESSNEFRCCKGLSLNAQLAQDTVPIGDLPLARVLLANDANYPWLILVPRLPGLVELIDLEDNAQVQLLGEIAAAADALKTVTRCDKLNIAALGNQVPQLHVHIIARRHTDAAWPKPVWGMKPPISYEQSQQTTLIDTLRQLLKPRGIVALEHAQRGLQNSR
jgi:diadenosine tetraphosphate (Ap4A) HIT family hydrolase